MSIITNLKNAYYNIKFNAEPQRIYDHEYGYGGVSLNLREPTQGTGMYKQWHDNGTLACVCSYVNGKKNGLCEYYYENGQTDYRCTYTNNKKDGLYEAFFPNGQIQEKCTYKNDQLDGIQEFYHKNGKLCVRKSFKNGFLDGSYEQYNENGTLIEKTIYHNGKALKKKQASEKQTTHMRRISKRKNKINARLLQKTRNTR